MTFIDTRLSIAVRPGFEGGPEWDTLSVKLDNGARRANQQRSMPLHKYRADYALLDPRDQNAVLSAFWVVAGSKDSFRFKDWNDFKIADESLGSGDGTATPRQLVKTYTFGPSTRVRTITKPVAGTLQVTANGSPLSVTVDTSTGLITPTATWPSGQAIVITAAEFDVEVHFTADYYPFEQAHERVGYCTVELQEERA